MSPQMRRCPICGLLCYDALYERDGKRRRIMMEAAPRSDGRAWLTLRADGKLYAERAGSNPERFRYASHEHSEAEEIKGDLWMPTHTE